MDVPTGAGDASVEREVRLLQVRVSLLARKVRTYRHVGRTKTDTGGRVQVYQGAREKPRQGTRQNSPVTSGEGVLQGNAWRRSERAHATV